MRKDKSDPIDVNPLMANLPFLRFKKLHEVDHPNDDAEKRYVKIGGKLPNKEVKKGD